MMVKRSFELRAIAVFIGLIFSWDTLLWSAEAVSFPSSRPVVSLEIPEALARVETSYFPADARYEKPLILIQDAHAAYPVQLKISKLLHSLKQTNAGKIQVLAEAAPANLHPENLKVSEDASLNLHVADRLMQWGELAGWENFIFEEWQNGGKPAEAHGVEDAQLYRRDWDAFKAVYRNQKKTRLWSEEITRCLEREALRIFPREAVRFFKAWKAYENGEGTLPDYFLSLKKAAAQNLGIEFSDASGQQEYPALVRLETMTRLESELAGSSESLAREEAQLRVRVKEWGLAGKFNSLLKSRSDFKGGENLRRLLEQFYDRAAPQGFQFENYPALSRHWGVRLLSSEIEAQELHAEMDRVRRKIFEHWAETTERQALLKLYSRQVLVEKLLSLRLTRAEYRKVRKSFTRLRPEILEGSIKLAASGKNSASMGLNPKIKQAFTQALNFYAIALQREKALFENAEPWLELNKNKLSVLVTGGFHTEGFEKVLRRKKIAYILLLPAAEEQGLETGLADAHRYYVQSLMQGEKVDSARSTMGLYSSLAASEDARASGVNAEYRGRRLREALRSEVRAMDPNRRRRAIVLRNSQTEQAANEMTESPLRSETAQEKPLPKRSWRLIVLSLGAGVIIGFAGNLVVQRPDVQKQVRRVWQQLFAGRPEVKPDEFEVKLPAVQPLGDEAIQEISTAVQKRLRAENPEPTQFKRTVPMRTPEPLTVPERIPPADREFPVAMPAIETRIPEEVLSQLKAPAVKLEQARLKGVFSVRLGTGITPFNIVDNIHRGQASAKAESYGLADLNNLIFTGAETNEQIRLGDLAKKPIVMIVTSEKTPELSARLEQMSENLQHLQFVYVVPAKDTEEEKAALNQLSRKKNNLFQAVFTHTTMETLGWVKGYSGFEKPRTDLFLLVPGKEETVPGVAFVRTGTGEALSGYLKEVERYAAQGQLPEIKAPPITPQKKIQLPAEEKNTRRSEVRTLTGNRREFFQWFSAGLSFAAIQGALGGPAAGFAGEMSARAARSMGRIQSEAKEFVRYRLGEIYLMDVGPDANGNPRVIRQYWPFLKTSSAEDYAALKRQRQAVDEAYRIHPLLGAAMDVLASLVGQIQKSRQTEENSQVQRHAADVFSSLQMLLAPFKLIVGFNFLNGEARMPEPVAFEIQQGLKVRHPGDGVREHGYIWKIVPLLSDHLLKGQLERGVKGYVRGRASGRPDAYRQEIGFYTRQDKDERDTSERLRDVLRATPEYQNLQVEQPLSHEQEDEIVSRLSVAATFLHEAWHLYQDNSDILSDRFIEPAAVFQELFAPFVLEGPLVTPLRKALIKVLLAIYSPAGYYNPETRVYGQARMQIMVDLAKAGVVHREDLPAEVVASFRKVLKKTLVSTSDFEASPMKPGSFDIVGPDSAFRQIWEALEKLSERQILFLILSAWNRYWSGAEAESAHHGAIELPPGVSQESSKHGALGYRYPGITTLSAFNYEDALQRLKSKYEFASGGNLGEASFPFGFIQNTGEHSPGAFPRWGLKTPAGILGPPNLPENPYKEPSQLRVKADRSFELVLPGGRRPLTRNLTRNTLLVFGSFDMPEIGLLEAATLSQWETLRQLNAEFGANLQIVLVLNHTPAAYARTMIVSYKGAPVPYVIDTENTISRWMKRSNSNRVLAAPGFVYLDPKGNAYEPVAAPLVEGLGPYKALYRQLRRDFPSAVTPTELEIAGGGHSKPSMPSASFLDDKKIPLPGPKPERMGSSRARELRENVLDRVKRVLPVTAKTKRSEVRSNAFQAVSEDLLRELTALSDSQPELVPVRERLEHLFSELTGAQKEADIRSVESRLILTRLNGSLQPQGYRVLLSYDKTYQPLLILYSLDQSRSLVRPTEEGPVAVHYIKKQITASEHWASGAEGWSEIFSDDVVINPPVIEALVRHIVEPMLMSVGTDFDWTDFYDVTDQNRELLTGQNKELFQRIFSKLIRGTFRETADARDIVAQIENLVLIHELDHERQRRAVYKMEIPFIDQLHYFGKYVETLAELRSMAEGQEPQYVLLMNLIDFIMVDPAMQPAYGAVLEGLAGVGSFIYREQLGGVTGLLTRLNELTDHPERIQQAAAIAYRHERSQYEVSQIMHLQSFRHFLASVPADEIDFWRNIFLNPRIPLDSDALEKLNKRMDALIIDLEKHNTQTRDPLGPLIAETLKFARVSTITAQTRAAQTLLFLIYQAAALLRRDPSLYFRQYDPIQDQFPAGFALSPAVVQSKSEVRAVRNYLQTRGVTWFSVWAVARETSGSVFDPGFVLRAPETVHAVLVGSQNKKAGEKIAYDARTLEAMQRIVNVRIHTPEFELDPQEPVHLIQPWSSNGFQTASLFMKRLAWLEAVNAEHPLHSPRVKMTFLISTGEAETPQSELLKDLRAGIGRRSGLTAEDRVRLAQILNVNRREVRLPEALRVERLDNFEKQANQLSARDQPGAAASAVITQETGLVISSDVSLIQDSEVFENPQDLAAFYLAREQILAKAAQRLRKMPADMPQADKIKALQEFLFLHGTGFYLGPDGKTIHWSLQRMLDGLHAELMNAQKVGSAA